MIQSRCGILCNECGYKEKVKCAGCLDIQKPFWGEECPIKSCCESKKLIHCGECETFPCDIINGFSYDKEQGDDGKRIEQCRVWGENNMNYEIVELSEKTIVGITARTQNSDENMGQVIGDLWQRLFGDGIFYGIENKINDKSIGLYSDYETDVNGKYDITVGCEVNGVANLPDGTNIKTIFAGKYAKFIVRGHMQKAVSDFWEKLWELPLDRRYSGDFEEYQAGGDIENAEIHIYIALK